MLLTIHNLPTGVQYSDVKELISKCGLEDYIVDNLRSDGAGMKVTVGVMEEADAALLVRKINGLYYGGKQLYVEDKRLTKQESEQPYRIKMAQQNQLVQPEQVPTAQPLMAYDYNTQVQAMYQNPAMNFTYAQQATPQSVQNAYMAYGSQQQLMSQYSETNAQQAFAVAQETENPFNKRSTSQSAGRGPQNKIVWEAAPARNDNRRRLASPPSDRTQPDPKRYKWDSREELSERMFDNRDRYQEDLRGSASNNRDGPYSNQRDGPLSSQRGSYASSQRGDYSSSQRGGYLSSQRGGNSSNQRGSYLSSLRGDHSSGQRGDHSSSQRGGYSSSQRGSHLSNQRGGHLSSHRDDNSSSQRGGHEDRSVRPYDDRARGDRKRPYDDSNDVAPWSRRDRRRSPQQGPGGDFSSSRAKATDLTVMHAIMADIMSHLNIKRDISGSSPFEEALRKLIFLRLADIPSNKDMSPEELIRLYRSKYPRTGDFAVCSRIKQKLAEGGLMNNASWIEYLSGFIGGIPTSTTRSRFDNASSFQNPPSRNQPLFSYQKPPTPALNSSLYENAPTRYQNPSTSFQNPSSSFKTPSSYQTASIRGQNLSNIRPKAPLKNRDEVLSKDPKNPNKPPRTYAAPPTPAQKLKICQTRAMTALLFETVQNLKIGAMMSKPSALKAALRKVIVLRVDDIMNKKPLDPDWVGRVYRERYPPPKDFEMYKQIKQKVAQCPNMAPAELKDFAFTFIKQAIPRPSRSLVREVRDHPNPSQAEDANDASRILKRSYLRANNMQNTMKIFKMVADNLHIGTSMEGASPLKSALRKLMSMRVGDIAQGSVQPSEKVIERYRELYPASTDQETYDAVKKIVAEESTEKPLQDVLQGMVVGSKPVVTKVPPLAVKPADSGSIPNYPQGDKKIFSQQKKQHKAELQTFTGYKLSGDYQKVLKEEIQSVGELMKKVFLNPRNGEEKLVYTSVNQDGCVITFTKFLEFHISKRMSDGGSKWCRIYGTPQTPKRAQLHQLLAPYNCLSLKKSVKNNFWTASFDRYDTIDQLCAMGPIDVGNNILVTFKHMHVAPKPKYSQKHAKNMRKKYCRSLIEDSIVNLLDKNWPAQEEQEKEAKAKKSKADDIILVENIGTSQDDTVETNDITNEDFSKDIQCDTKKNADTSVEKGEFLHGDFKVIDEVRESDNDEIDTTQEGTVDLCDQIAGDWDQNGEDWTNNENPPASNENIVNEDENIANGREHVTNMVENDETIEENDEIVEENDEFVGDNDEVVDENAAENDCNIDESDANAGDYDDNAEDDDIEEILEYADDIDIADIDLDNVEDDDLEDY